ncbi:MAG: hypothetical protein IJV31_10600 [Clostridia bacterium]|nr:hypothetical protein [Clostridia bacterium]
MNGRKNNDSAIFPISSKKNYVSKKLKVTLSALTGALAIVAGAMTFGNKTNVDNNGKNNIDAESEKIPESKENSFKESLIYEVPNTSAETEQEAIEVTPEVLEELDKYSKHNEGETPYGNVSEILEDQTNETNVTSEWLEL